MNGHGLPGVPRIPYALTARLRGDMRKMVREEFAAQSGVTDHGQLEGLTDDDHTQYLTEVRGDVRYYTKGEIGTLLEGVAVGEHDHDGVYQPVGSYVVESALTAALSAYALDAHDHDGVYQPVGSYVTDATLATELADYYTETEANALLADKADAVDVGAKVVVVALEDPSPDEPDGTVVIRLAV